MNLKGKAVNNLEKEVFNQYLLDSLEDEILTPNLDSGAHLDVPPSKMGIPGTLGIMSSVERNLIDAVSIEKTGDDDCKAHNYFDLNFKINHSNNIKLNFDLSFILYYKSFPNFESLNLYNIHKFINKKIRNKKREIFKEYNNNKDDSYEDKEYKTIEKLKSDLNYQYNNKNHSGLSLAIDRIVSLLKNNSYINSIEDEKLEEIDEIELHGNTMPHENLFEENQFLFNEKLFIDNQLNKKIYDETINLFTENNDKLYKEFFNEIPPNYQYKPIEIKISDIEVDVPLSLSENDNTNKNINNYIIDLIKKEIQSIINEKKINININKKMSLINFLSKEKYLAFIENNNIAENNNISNILIYYPKIKVIRNGTNLKIIVCGADFVSEKSVKSIPLFDDRLFNTQLITNLSKSQLNTFKYTGDNHYKYEHTKPIYCQSNHIATFHIIDNNFLTIKTTWNPKYYLPRNENTGINIDKDLDIKLFSYSTWSTDKDLDFSIMEEIPKKYREWIEKIPLDNITKEGLTFKKDLKNWNTEIQNIQLGIDLLKFSYFNRGNPYLSTIFDSWKYLNETFSLIEPEKYTEWRLFQFCFLLSLIPAIVLKNENIFNILVKEKKYEEKYLNSILKTSEDSVNLLFFNAGGGKTEAFLSVIIYTMFFERLTGITHGITAILKYPLRLLLTQQTNRVLKAICAAEIVRKKINFNKQDKFDSCFSLGVWVGSSSTPNKIDTEVKDHVLELTNPDGLNFRNNNYHLLWETKLLKEIWTTNLSNEQDEEKQRIIKSKIKELKEHMISNLNLDGVESLDKYFITEEEKYQKIDTCPFCGKNELTIRIYKKTLFHFCLNQNCQWNFNQQYRGLPFYIVDDNIYERSPTVIISTTDKLSKMGYINKSTSNLNKNILPENRKILGIFGVAPYFDTQEKKYLWTNDKKNKNIIKLFQNKEKTIKFPSWIVQDETHLLVESLGSFSAIFERNFSHTILSIQKILKEYTVNLGLPYVIASTATMASPEKQLLPIYDKNNICLFPALGYKIYENFYSKPEEKINCFSIIDSENEYEKYNISRIYNGFILNEMAYFKTANHIALLHHKKLNNLFLGIDKETFIKGIKNQYYYNIAKKIFVNSYDFDSYIKENVILNKVLINYTGNKNTNEKLKKWENDICTLDGDFKNIINLNNQVSITSDVNITELSANLERIKKEENDFDSDDLNKRTLRSIFATQSISHGVDSPQFNSMIFHGFPEFINEYIQASARIGRTNVGFVNVLPLRNNKDRQIMNNFEYFHRFIDRPVLANTIDFKTKVIIEKSLPSLFVSWYINIYSLNLENLDKINMENVNNPDIFDSFSDFIQNVLQAKLELPKMDYNYEATSLKELLEKNWGKLMTSLRDTERNAKIIIGEKNDKK